MRSSSTWERWVFSGNVLWFIKFQKLEPLRWIKGISERHNIGPEHLPHILVDFKMISKWYQTWDRHLWWTTVNAFESENTTVTGWNCIGRFGICTLTRQARLIFNWMSVRESSGFTGSVWKRSGSRNYVEDSLPKHQVVLTYLIWIHWQRSQLKEM